MKKKYLCANCGIVEDFIYFDEELDCDLCEDCKYELENKKDLK